MLKRSLGLIIFGGLFFGACTDSAGPPPDGSSPGASSHQFEVRLYAALLTDGGGRIS